MPDTSDSNIFSKEDLLLARGLVSILHNLQFDISSPFALDLAIEFIANNADSEYSAIADKLLTIYARNDDLLYKVLMNTGDTAYIYRKYQDNEEKRIADKIYRLLDDIYSIVVQSPQTFAKSNITLDDGFNMLMKYESIKKPVNDLLSRYNRAAITNAIKDLRRATHDEPSGNIHTQLVSSALYLLPPATKEDVENNVDPLDKIDELSLIKLIIVGALKSIMSKMKSVIKTDEEREDKENKRKKKKVLLDQASGGEVNVDEIVDSGKLSAGEAARMKRDIYKHWSFFINQGIPKSNENAYPLAVGQELDPPHPSVAKNYRMYDFNGKNKSVVVWGGMPVYNQKTGKNGIVIGYEIEPPANNPVVSVRVAILDAEGDKSGLTDRGPLVRVQRWPLSDPTIRASSSGSSESDRKKLETEYL